MRNGLGEIERRALEGIAEGATDFVSLFTHFDESPPRFGFGDSEALYACYALHPQPAYLDHPALIGRGFHDLWALAPPIRAIG